jgi:pimeloyl-ACP methyl ester carboxylesterase
MMDSLSEKIDHSRRRLVGSAAAVAAAIPLGIIGSVEARPQETKHASSPSADKPAGATVVLVHGAWADGSGWARVITPLQSKGLKAVAAPIPLTSLSDDIAALEWTLERTEGPVVLVAHAYSGAVVGACRNERVQALVFITSLTPDAGETVAEVFFREKSQAPHLAPDGHNLLWIPPEQFHDAWCQNASPKEAALLAATQRPISVACIQEKAPAPLWKTKPSWYLVAEEDRMINPTTQQFLAHRMRARIQSKKVDHAVLITAPDVVVEMILEAVASASTHSGEEKSNARRPD